MIKHSLWNKMVQINKNQNDHLAFDENSPTPIYMQVKQLITTNINI